MLQKQLLEVDLSDLVFGSRALQQTNSCGKLQSSNFRVLMCWFVLTVTGSSFQENHTSSFLSLNLLHVIETNQI